MVSIWITTITGVRANTKSIKPSPVALPIIMLGGSPISVAVPPMLEATTSAIRNGITFICSSLAMAKVTGTTSKTVVTLSKRADATAVMVERESIMATGSPLATLAEATAMYSKTPVCLVIPTITIIPIKRPMVLKSMDLNACSWLIIPASISITAPARATTVR